MVTSPIIVLICTTIFLKEKLKIIKIIGVIIGLVGATILIVYGNSVDGDAQNKIVGNLLVFINAVSYGLYLVLDRRLVIKYNPIVFTKWRYLFGLLFVIPFGYSEFLEVEWQQIPVNIYYKIGFVIFFATCLIYLFNLFALSKLKPITVSVFIYNR